MRISDWSSDVCSSDRGRCATRYGGHEPCARMRRDFAENALIEALRVRAMDKRLLDILVCPVTKAPLVWRADLQELWCHASRLAYPVRDGEIGRASCWERGVSLRVDLGGGRHHKKT